MFLEDNIFFYMGGNMEDLQLANERLLDKYNNENDIARCPRGRAKFKEQLDNFTAVSVLLYGVIELKDLTRIYNEVYDGDLLVSEVKIMLLPFIIENGDYYFYKDFVIDPAFFESLDLVDDFYKDMDGNEFYVPSKADYSDFDVIFNSSFDIAFAELFAPLYKINDDLFYNIFIVKKMFSCDFHMSLVIEYLSSLVEVNLLEYPEIINSLFDLMNNTRLPSNRGYTLAELASKEGEFNAPIKIVKETKRNDPCHCGSGKKYKKCCLTNTSVNNDCINLKQKTKFYSIWYDLLRFINQKNDVFNTQNIAGLPDQKLFELRSILWQDRSVINEYIKTDKSLDDDAIYVLKQWYEKAYEGSFFVVDHLESGTVLNGFDHDTDDKVYFYEVKGMKNSIGRLVNFKKHIFIHTVVLPFEDTIIYDTFIGEQPISMSKTVIDTMIGEYDNAVKNNEIITML
jgi:hypothetical protein